MVLKGGVVISVMQFTVVWIYRAKGFNDYGEYKIAIDLSTKVGSHHHSSIRLNIYTKLGFLRCFVGPEEAEVLTTRTVPKRGQRQVELQLHRATV